MIITICGDEGSGKGTVGKLLSKKLNYEYLSMGDIRRNFAKERGMTLEQLNEQAETDPTSDKLVDEHLVEIGKTRDDLVIDGRLAFHFIPQSFKLYFLVEKEEGARRIWEAKRNEEQYSTLDKTIKSLKARRASDITRYMNLYGVNPYYITQGKYDGFVNTTRNNPEETVHIVELLLKHAGKYQPKPNAE